MNTNDISTKIENLPDHIKSEVFDYIEFLLNKYGGKKYINVNLNLIGKADYQN